MRTLSHRFVTSFASAGRCELTDHDAIYVRTMEAFGAPACPPSPNRIATRSLSKPVARRHGRLLGTLTKPSSDSVSAAKIALSLQTAVAHLDGDAVVIASDGNQNLGDWITGHSFGRSIQACSVRVIIGAAMNCQGPENAFASKRLTL